MLTIEAASYFVPKTKLKPSENLQHFALTQTQARVYETFYGLKYVPFAENMSIESLLRKSINKLMHKTVVESSQIKYLIHAHTGKVLTVFGQSLVRNLKQKLKFTDAIAFSTSANNCVSIINAMLMVRNLLRKKTHCNDKAIVVVGERAFTRTARVIPNSSITADASAAMLLSNNQNGAQLLTVEMHCAGEFSAGIWLSEAQNKHFDETYIDLLARTITKAVRKLNLSLADIKLIVPHNVNLISWKKLAKTINYPLEKIYLENVQRYAHCFGADILINYIDAQRAGYLQRGDYFIMATVGLGATFAAAVFRY